jgi:hypothetical protein
MEPGIGVGSEEKPVTESMVEIYAGIDLPVVIRLPAYRLRQPV